MTAALLLLPGLVPAGLLIPGTIRVSEPAKATPAWMPSGPIMPVLPIKTPLVVQRDFSAGFIPELLDLERLFLSSRFQVEPSTRYLARLLSFPRSDGDAIVLDDVGRFVEKIVFRDAMAARSVTSAEELPPMPDFLPLHDTLPRGNGVRDDDFPGAGIITTAMVVPEPTTGVLFGSCLALLGLYHRRRSACTL